MKRRLETLRGRSGYTLMEIVVVMAVFVVFLGVLMTLTLEMWRYEKRLPVDFMRHPQIMAVIARLRRDVLDAHTKDPYRTSYEGYTMSDKVLILEMIDQSGSAETVVWDFSTPQTVVRRAYRVGNVSQWVARGVPREFSYGMTLDGVTIAETPSGKVLDKSHDRPYGVRLVAKDANGRIAIDQIFQPRTTE